MSTPGPEWYSLADQRQFYELQKSEIVPLLELHNVPLWSSHAILSAAEHFFRTGAKPGESESDEQAANWWINQVDSKAVSVDVIYAVADIVRREREALNR
jgi:hypothetical protein